MEEDIENIGEPRAGIYTVTETLVLPTHGGVVKVSCEAGDAAIGGKFSPKEVFVENIFTASDYNETFVAVAMFNYGDGVPGPKSIEVTAVCAHIPIDE